MTIEHRKADILNQMFQANASDLIANLATALEQIDALKAKVAELEKQVPAAAAPPPPS